MFELLTLFAALLLIFAVHMLRAVLAMPFARVRAAFVPPLPPAPLAPLFVEAFAELAALGFGPPRGVLQSRTDGEPVPMPWRAVLVHEDGTTAWLGPPPAPKRPHRLHVLYASRLADGRSAISQPFDPYFACAQNERLVARTGLEPAFAAQLAAHREWVAGLGSEVVPADEHVLADMAGPENERIRAALIARGALRALGPDVAVPRFAFAIRLLWTYLRTPNPPPDARPVPPERLALLARAIEIVRHRAPPRTAQWILFGVSVLLFMAIGAAFWNAQVALAILVVVIVHELGHFLAMRAFGYRNTHILALPLVGGVAMGIDAAPHATKRAWMSLMGPLPGIFIGWALLALALSGAAPEWMAGSLLPLAAIFLFVNYLNVLPIPPLDGAHVVDAMLPPRMARVQTVFLAIAATVGGWLAWQYGLPLLTFLAGLQLLGLPAMWRLHGVERELAGFAAHAAEAPAAKMLRVLRTLERRLGPATNAAQRVGQATAVITRLDTKPMGHLARLATGIVYAVLLAVPVAALVMLPEMFATPSARMESGTAGPEQSERERDSTLARAAALPLAELLRVPGADALPESASVDVIADAEKRLGRALPTDLRNVYAVANGSESAGLFAIEDVRAAAAYLDEWIAPYAKTLALERESGAWVEIPLADARGWWHVGGDDEAPLFYLPDGHAQLPGKRVVSWFLESPSAHADVREWLVQAWAERAESERYLAQARERERVVRAELRDAPVARLLASFEQPSLLVRMMIDEPAWPDGADDAALDAAADRLGLALPPDLRELYALHDGFPPLGVLPSAQLATWADSRARFVERHEDLAQRIRTVQSAASGGGEALGGLETSDLERCVLVAANAVDERLMPRLAWCAPTTPHAGWIDVGAARRHASFRDWLLEQAVPMAAALRAVE